MPKNLPTKSPKFIAENESDFRVLQETGKMRVGEIDYAAKLCELKLHKEGSSDYALMRCIFYQRENQGEHRPITLCFNGGPGSSSVWLHMGALGPYRVKTDQDGIPVESNGRYALEENQDTLLQDSDLLFIDPIGTGWSRSYPESTSTNYWGVQQDVESIGLFVRHFLRHFKRASDPIFIAGESYGTTRAVVLADHLQSVHHISPKGISLISMVLTFPTIIDTAGMNDQVYLNLIPTMAMAGHYHGKVSDENLALSREALLEKARRFVADEYLPFLYRGFRVTDTGELDAMATKLEELTGLDKKELKKHNCRISLERYLPMLFEEDWITVGAYDARIKGRTKANPEDGTGELYEPSSAVLEKAVSGLFYDYTSNMFDTDRFEPYETLNMEVFDAWDFGRHESEAGFDATPHLENALQYDDKLLVHVACGLYDLVTPAHASEKTMDHLELFYHHPDTREQIGFGYYEGGHMLYTVPSEKERLIYDIRNMMHRRLGLVEELVDRADKSPLQVGPALNRFASFSLPPEKTEAEFLFNASSTQKP